MGLDVSPLRMGWGLADLETFAPVACGAFDFEVDAAPSTHRWALGGIGVLSDLGEIAAIYIEAPHVGINRKVAIDHALTVGSAWQAASRRWPDAVLAFVQPSEWKRRAGVEPQPKTILKGKAGREYVAERALTWAHDGCSPEAMPDGWAWQILSADKPYVMARALELGFAPNGSQDAADAGLIAVAGALINAEVVAISEAD